VLEDRNNLMEVLSCSLPGIEGEHHCMRLVARDGVVRDTLEISFKAHGANNDGFLGLENG